MNKSKSIYISPKVKVIEMDTDCIIATSGDAGTEKYGINGNSYGDDDFE